MNIRYTFINNQILPEQDSKLGVTDLSIQRGYGIFDFLKTLENKPIFIDEHLERFYNSAKEMYLLPPLDKQQLKDAIRKLMEKNDIPDSGIKIVLTGGYSEDGYTLGKPNLIITQTPLQLAIATPENGLKLVTYNHQRQIAQAKTIDYVQAIRLQPFVKENGADDLLYHDKGTIRECPRSNFFIVTENEIITPETHILKGVIRSKILSMGMLGYTISAKDFTLQDLNLANEAFISSTTKNAFPVVAIDGKMIGDGKMGKVTAKINELLNKLIKY